MFAIAVVLVIVVHSCVTADLFSQYPSLVLTDKELAEAENVISKVQILMTAPEVAFFLRFLRNGTSYFEFGVGGSTMVASGFGPENLNITGIDSSKEWIDVVKKDERCSKKVDRGLLHVDFVDIGPIGAWGFPTQTVQESKGAWYLYSQAISMTGGHYDVVLVDGRFRVACVLNTFLSNPSATVMVHDFLEEDHHLHYKVLLEVADLVNRVHTLVELRRKPSASKIDIMKMYATYIHVPNRT
jgi:hypothetical protein